ncbi:MAG: LuxR C-terminal-related transcriptional regulator [Planctomycetota bacterium]
MQLRLGEFQTAIESFGFTAFTFGYAPLRKGQVDSSGTAFYTSLPPKVMEEYLAAERETFDLVFQLMAFRFQPFTKGSVEPLFSDTPQQQSIVDWADDCGIPDALMVPLSTADFCRGAVLFTGERPEAFAERVARDTPTLRHLAAEAMHDAEHLGFGAQAREKPALTDRETECLQTLAQGKTNAEAAAALGLSERTVRFHLSNACEKLGTQRRAQAVTRAIQQGLIRT